MKLLYIVPKIKCAGGVARVLSVKANYFVEKFGYEVHILSQNEEEAEPFFSFNPQIIFHNMNLKGREFQFFFSFQKAVNQKVNEIKPDVILVADNGLKAFVYPFILKTKTPIVLEVHGSKYVEEKARQNEFFLKLKYGFKNYGASKFTKMVALSNESLQEWNVKNAVVIPNPSWIDTNSKAALQSKKVIVVARNSYEKGLERLLLIWEKVIKKHPNWILEIYGNSITDWKPIVSDLGLKSNVTLSEPVINISEKYLGSSIFVMTSLSEGFPMVLIEAMTYGLPCIAFDCPIGPRAIIKNEYNGFLIPDGNDQLFIEKVTFLIENEEQRLKFGFNAKETSKQFSVEKIMEQWKLFLENLLLH